MHLQQTSWPAAAKGSATKHGTALHAPASCTASLPQHAPFPCASVVALPCLQVAKTQFQRCLMWSCSSSSYCRESCRCTNTSPITATWTLSWAAMHLQYCTPRFCSWRASTQAWPAGPPSLSWCGPSGQHRAAVCAASKTVWYFDSLTQQTLCAPYH